MRDKFLKKIVKKDYNNNLEEVLSKKNFSEEVKNTLLSMFYKIENGYNDYNTIKRNTFDKTQYIEKLIKIIKEDCEKIEFIKNNDKKEEFVDREKKQIICLPIENKILYSISKIQKRTLVVKYIDEEIEEAFSDLLNIGNNINIVEPLRDFNGFSWNIIVKDIEDVNINLIYQNIIFLLGNEFVDKWVNNYEPLVDYFDLFQSKIEKEYGKKAKESIITNFIKLSIKIKIDKDENLKKQIEIKKQELEQEKSRLENKEQYLKDIVEQKKQKERKIKEIDKIIKNKKLLIEEYEKRNENLPLDKKIFSIRVLKINLEKERENILNEIEKENNIMKPKHFLEKKSKIEEKLKCFDVLDNYEISKNIIKLQKEIIKCINTKIKRVQNKNELIDLIYKYRYYCLLPIDKKRNIHDIKELKNNLQKLTKNLIEKAIQMKVINQIIDDENMNQYITEKIILTKIITLEDINIKLTKENEEIYLTIYDEKIEDSKIELKEVKKNNFKIKFNKKIKLFI